MKLKSATSLFLSCITSRSEYEMYYISLYSETLTYRTYMELYLFQTQNEETYGMLDNPITMFQIYVQSKDEYEKFYYDIYLTQLVDIGIEVYGPRYESEEIDAN